MHSALWTENTPITKTVDIQSRVLLHQKTVKFHYFTSLNFWPEIIGNSARARQYSMNLSDAAW